MIPLLILTSPCPQLRFVLWNELNLVGDVVVIFEQLFYKEFFIW